MTDFHYAANRHERRRQTVIVEKREVALSEIKEVRCGWRGCQAFHSLDQSPEGWSNLICHETPIKKAVLKVNVGGKPRAVLDLERLAWRHDVTLCPDHTQMLADLLDGGPDVDRLLSETAGRA
jgi:hypothetical protein